MDPLPTPPAVYRLAPGLRVVRRGRDRLQVGLYADRRVVLPRSPAVERLLAALVEQRPVGATSPDAARALAALTRHGCAVPVDTGSVGLTVAVLGSLPHIDADGLLASVGLEPAPPGDADVVLVLAVGEVARERLDLLVRRCTSHLVVRLVDGGAVIGPFVVPGRTACLRCLDAHQSTADPEHVAVTERYVRAATPRSAGVPELPDAATATFAAGWAVRDLLAHASGDEPSTWSRTWRLGPGPDHLSGEQWLRHPQCGCSWSGDAQDYGTMGA